MIEYIQQIDKDVINFIHNNLQHETLNRVMAFITAIGEYGFIWIILITSMFLSEKHRKIACIAAMSFLMSRLIGVQILKPLISRPRPFIELDYLNIYISQPTTYSFPSGHTLSSFSTALVVIEMIEQFHYKIILLFAAILISISRLYLMVHYPSDILAGLGLAVFTSYFALFVFRETIVQRN